MITDTDKHITDSISQQADLYGNLKQAVEYAISEVKPSCWDHYIAIWLNFNIRGRRGVRVTPYVNIPTGFFPWECGFKELSDIHIDMNDVYDQVTQRLTREKLTWDDVEIDIFKKHINDGYVALKVNYSEAKKVTYI